MKAKLWHQDVHTTYLVQKQSDERTNGSRNSTYNTTNGGSR